MKVLINGAGIAGTTLAWWLERDGWEVELLEKAPAFRAGGYLVDFYGPGPEVIRRMGLAGRLAELDYGVTGMEYVRHDGRRITGLKMSQIEAFDGELVNVLRGDLAALVHGELRCPVTYGVTVEAIEQDDTGVEVTLTDGGRRRVDLLVGADGVHSRVRELMFGPEPPFLRYLNHHVAAFTIDAPELSERVGRLYRMIGEPGLMFGAYGLRDGGLGVLAQSREPEPVPPADPVAFLRERFGHFGWLVPDVLERLPGDLYYDIVTQTELDRWSRGRVVLLGDACQAVSLFAGHGAALAMAAAWVLRRELVRSGPALEPAFARYERTMRPKVAEVQAFGRGFVEWMAPSSWWRITVRNALIRAAVLPGVGRLLGGVMVRGTEDLIVDETEGAWTQ